jgi:hypothetical protein
MQRNQENSVEMIKVKLDELKKANDQLKAAKSVQGKFII